MSPFPRPDRFRPDRSRLIAGSALAAAGATVLSAVIGAAPTSAALNSSVTPAVGASTAATVRHQAATTSATCRDGAGARWTVAADWQGTRTSSRTTTVRIGSVRWTTKHGGRVSTKITATVTDGNGRKAGSTSRKLRADYHGGRTWKSLNPVDPVADDAPAVIAITIGTRGAKSCRITLTERISKPTPKPTPKPTAAPTSAAPTSAAPTSASPTGAATSAAPTSSPTSAASAATTYRSDVFAGTNGERTKAGLTRFGSTDCVARFAQAQADRMAAEQRMYHQDLGPILTTCGLRTVGENVAYGFPSGASVVTAWMNSPGHRANILNASYRSLGVGAAKGADGRWYAAQVFGG